MAVTLLLDYIDKWDVVYDPNLLTVTFILVALKGFAAVNLCKEDLKRQFFFGRKVRAVP